MAFCFSLDKLAHDPYDVAAWYLFFLLPEWCLVLLAHGMASRHKEMWIQLKCFQPSNWENL